MSDTGHKLTPEELDQLWVAFKQKGNIDAKNDILLHYGYLVNG